MVNVPLTSLGPEDPRNTGPYVLEGRFSAGERAVVYLGRHQSGHQVVIKMFRGSWLSDRETRRSLEAEVAALRTVTSFATARLLEARLDGPAPFLVSEYVPGPSLADEVRSRGPLGEAAVVRVGVGLLTGLRAVHSAGVVHRDLKPTNVILGPDGPRLVDYGLVGLTGTVTGPDDERPDGLADARVYQAPEMLYGGHVTTAADMYAWGATMVFATSGQGVPTQPPADGRYPGMTLAMSTLVAQCLSPDPLRRPLPNAAMDRLLAITASGAPGADSQSVGPPASPGQPVVPSRATGRDFGSHRRVPAPSSGGTGATPAFGLMTTSSPIEAEPSDAPTASGSHRAVNKRRWLVPVAAVSVITAGAFWLVNRPIENATTRAVSAASASAGSAQPLVRRLDAAGSGAVGQVTGTLIAAPAQANDLHSLAVDDNDVSTVSSCSVSRWNLATGEHAADVALPEILGRECVVGLAPGFLVGAEQPTGTLNRWSWSDQQSEASWSQGALLGPGPIMQPPQFSPGNGYVAYATHEGVRIVQAQNPDDVWVAKLDSRTISWAVDDFGRITALTPTGVRQWRDIEPVALTVLTTPIQPGSSVAVSSHGEIAVVEPSQKRCLVWTDPAQNSDGGPNVVLTDSAGGPITAVTFRETNVLQASGVIATGSAVGVRLWDIAAKAPLGSWLVPPAALLNTAPTLLAFSPNGGYLVAQYPDGQLVSWPITTMVPAKG